MSIKETDPREHEDERTEDGKHPGGSRASEEAITANPRLNSDAGHTRGNPRFNDDHTPEEEPAEQASGYDEVAKSMGSEAEAVAKEFDGIETDGRTEEEILDEAVRSAFTETVSKEAESLENPFDWTGEDVEKAARPTSKSANAEVLARIEEMVAEDRSLTKEEVREVVLEVLAETSGEAGKTASQLLAEVEGRTEKALGELDQLLAQIHESEEESKAETASKGEGTEERERVTVKKSVGPPTPEEWEQLRDSLREGSEARERVESRLA